MNVLANRALSTGTTTMNSDKNNDSQAPSGCSDPNEYHLHEVLSLLPNLQHGMDVNPKFTAGPTGVEYTNNLAAFDLLGVELVHGWLLDPQDVETVSVVQSKTYNELIETVIHGSEAREALQKIEERLRYLEMILEETSGMERLSTGGTINTATDGDCQHGVIREQVESGDINANHPTKESYPTITNTTTNQNDNIDPTTTTPEQYHPPEVSQEDSITSQLNEIIDTKDKLSELSLQITQSEVANAFLSLSGHQLTYHGLEQLHTHVGEDSLCVFFRNNHFATLTKHNGVLYLLVTDLGYANTPEIVWEKLDSIDGDTEYCNEFFEKPAPRTELKPASGPTIAPELLLAHRSQAESDYQLALALSKGDATSIPQQTNNGTQRVEDEEIKLIEAAKELSLKTYQQENSDSAEFIAHDVSAYASDRTDVTLDDLDREVAKSNYQQHVFTEQQQSEHESEQLARQLQGLEYRRQRPVATNPSRQAAGSTATATTMRSASKRNGPSSSNCSIS